MPPFDQKDRGFFLLLIDKSTVPQYTKVDYMSWGQPDYHHFIGRVNDVKTGTLVGMDKYGNKYFEDTKHYFFGESSFPKCA